MKKRVLMFVVAALIATALLSGCGLKESEVPYADDMVENLLQGMEQNDYAMFSRDFSDEMKAAIDEDAFDAMVESFSTIIGAYESKSFYQAANTTQDDIVYTVVIYKAKFTDEEDDVLITVTFSGEEGSKVIDGLYFNSAKLRGE